MANFISTPPSYVLEVVSSQGTFEVNIDDLKGKIMIGEVKKISNSTCFDYSSSEFTTLKKIVQIDKFLKDNFNLHQATLQLVQEDVRNNHQILRFLYADDSLKQTTIYLEQSGSTVTLARASLMNLGYGVLNPDP